MRSLLALLLLGWLAPAGHSQMVRVYFKKNPAPKQYKKFLTRHEGRDVVYGEPKSGIRQSEDKKGYVYSNKLNEVYVPVSGDPLAVPYAYKKGERVVKIRKAVASINGGDIEKVQVVSLNETLEGLAREYQLRQGQIDRIHDQQKRNKKGTAAWFAKQLQLTAELETLHSWLRNTGFAEAAKKLEKEINKQKKTVVKSAVAEREKAGQDSVAVIETPAELAEKADEITGGELEYHVAESQHFRIVYPVEMWEDSRIEQLLRTAEKMTHSFRVDFVDPYLDSDFEDYIPDDIFLEWFFINDNNQWKDRFFTEYYGGNWGADKERSLKMKGNGLANARGVMRTYVWNTDETDLDGIVAHNLGHTLAQVHYNKGSLGGNIDWIKEAVGYYVSFEHLGRNTVTCFQFSKPEYAKAKVEEVDKELRMGEREYFYYLALDKGPMLDALAIKKLSQMDTADFAKSWSLFEYVAEEEGKRGQLWLRAACQASKTKSSYIRKWRERSEGLFEVEGEDVFRVVENRWKEFARKRSAPKTSGKR